MNFSVVCGKHELPMFKFVDSMFNDEVSVIVFEVVENDRKDVAFEC